MSRTLTLRKSKSRPAAYADATKDWAAPKVETAKDWAAPKVETAKDWAAPKGRERRRQGQERRAPGGRRRGDRSAGRHRAGAHRGGLPRQRRAGRPQGRGRGPQAQEAPHPQAARARHRPRRGLRRLEGLGVPAAEQRPGLAVDVRQQHDLDEHRLAGAPGDRRPGRRRPGRGARRRGRRGDGRGGRLAGRDRAGDRGGHPEQRQEGLRRSEQGRHQEELTTPAAPSILTEPCGVRPAGLSRRRRWPPGWVGDSPGRRPTRRRRGCRCRRRSPRCGPPPTRTGRARLAPRRASRSSRPPSRCSAFVRLPVFSAFSDLVRLAASGAGRRRWGGRWPGCCSGRRTHRPRCAVGDPVQARRAGDRPGPADPAASAAASRSVVVRPRAASDSSRPRDIGPPGAGCPARQSCPPVHRGDVDRYAVRRAEVVETRGLEPLTPALQRRCSAS